MDRAERDRREAGKEAIGCTVLDPIGCGCLSALAVVVAVAVGLARRRSA